MYCDNVGVFLSLVGMFVYGIVIFLVGCMVINFKECVIEEEGFVKWFLLVSIIVMGIVSFYFMYILNVKLDGVFCIYCVGLVFFLISFFLCIFVVSLFYLFVFLLLFFFFIL